MKRTLLIFLALALVSTFAFAEAMAGGEASISGSVSLTAGYDLDSEGYGFQNDTDIQVVLPILGGDGGASGDDGVYAEITIDNINWEWNLDEGGLYDTDEDDGDVLTADIEATLHFNNLYLGLGSPDFEMNNVDVSDDYLVDAWADALDNGGGFTFGFKNDMIDIALMVASEKDGYMDDTDDGNDALDSVDSHTYWNNDNDDDDDTDDFTSNEDGDMIFGVMATINAAEGVTIPLSFFYDAANNSSQEDIIAFGMAPSIVMGDLTFDLPVDYVNIGDYGSGFELEPAVGYTVMEGFNVAARFLYGSYTDVTAAAITDVGNLELADSDPVTYTSEGDIGYDVKNAVAEFGITLTDSSAFVPGLEWMLDISMVDMMDYMDQDADGIALDVVLETSYMMGGMKPYLNIDYGFGDAEMELGLGVVFDADFTGIDNTVITLDYMNDVIFDGEAFDGDTDGDTESGRITLDVTVSF